MANFLTTGRAALIAALQDDEDIDELVKTWHTFGAGPSRRDRILYEPTYCPILSVYPAGLEDEQRANVYHTVGQDVEIEICVDQQDVATGEELLALTRKRISAERAAMMSLADLRNIALTGKAEWNAYQSKDDARVLWTIVFNVRLSWHIQEGE